jgi:hypothetical protein
MVNIEDSEEDSVEEKDDNEDKVYGIHLGGRGLNSRHPLIPMYMVYMFAPYPTIFRGLM